MKRNDCDQTMSFVSGSEGPFARLIVLMAFFILSPAVSRADEIKVIASNAVKEAIVHALPAFTVQSGHQVASSWDGTVNIVSRATAGEKFDLVIIPEKEVDLLIRRGIVRADNPPAFAKSPIGVAVRPGVALPDLSSGDTLKQALLDTPKVVLSSGPSSGHMATLFKQMGIDKIVEAKTLRLAPGLAVGEALAQGHGDIGFTQVSELLHIRGIVYVGPLPADVQRLTIFALGMSVNPPHAEAARQLVQFLTSPVMAPTIRDAGMEAP